MKTAYPLRPIALSVLVAMAVMAQPAHSQTETSPYSTYISYPVSTNPTDWTVDRSPPASPLTNIGTFEGHNDVLQFGVNPPASPQSFYGWQGYQQRMSTPAGNSFIGGDLWINPAWQSGTDTDYVRTGMWGSAMPAAAVQGGSYNNDKASMPIMSFTNRNGVGRLEVWDVTANPDTGWVDLPQTAGIIQYGGWNSIDMRLLPAEGKIEYYLNGSLIYTWQNPTGNDDGSLPQQFWAMYLNARNNGVTSFNTHWSDLLAGELVSNGKAITDTKGDVIVAPSASGAAVPSVVANGANIGGSLGAQGQASKPAVVAFEGDAAIAQNVTGSNAVIAFSQDPSATTSIGGNVNLDAATTLGGTVVHPIQVAGNIAADSKSVLGGNWQVAGNVRNAGELNPGNSIGVIGVGRNLVLTSTSNYRVEVNAAGASDKVNVAGAAELAGGLTVAASDDYALGRPYTILTAQGGFSGTVFDADKLKWDRADYLFIEPVVTYGQNDVYLTIDRNGRSFASVAATPNQAAAAQGLDSLAFGNAAHDAVSRMTSAAGAPAAFDQLSGEIHASATSVLMGESRLLRDGLNSRVRSAFERTDSEQPAKPADGNPVEVWAQALGEWGSYAGGSNASSVSSSTGGLLFGADTLLGDSVRLGVMGGASRSSFDAKSLGSSGNSDNYHAGIYGGTEIGNVGIRSGATYTWHNIDAGRSIAFQGYSDHLNSDYGAKTAQIFGDVGYKFGAGPLVLEPFAGIAYVNVNTDAFSEKGGAAALSGKAESMSSAFSTLGVRGKSTFNVGDVVLTARGSVGWQHAFGTVIPASTMSFSGGTPFIVTGVPLSREAALVEAAIGAAVGKKVHLGIGYTGQLGTDVKSHGVIGTFKYLF